MHDGNRQPLQFIDTLKRQTLILFIYYDIFDLLNINCNSWNSSLNIYLYGDKKYDIIIYIKASIGINNLHSALII